MKAKNYFLKNYFLKCLFLFQVIQLHAQIPFSNPQSDTNWGSWNRKIYDGNWLLNSGGTNYFATPSINSSITNTTVNTIDFGINDFNTDVNFNTQTNANFNPPLPLTPIIRVGKKFNQTNQGLLSPVRRAAVATFSFNPTINNYKIRVYYIGMLQELSSDPAYYGNVVANYRKDPKGEPAQFGLFCRYDYYSNLTNPATVSRAGRTEFGTVDPLSATTFTNNANNVNYGLNDMFSFYQAGTAMRTLPPNTNINKKMDQWDHYDMDFSEFIGGTVTITLFASTSNYSGNSQNHSYCYYQLQPMDTSATPPTFPVSQLSISTDPNNPTINDLGCKLIIPPSVGVKITNSNPTILGNQTSATPTQINNNSALKWLNILNTSANYNSNFASLGIEIYDGTNWNTFQYITGGSDITLAFGAAIPTITTLITNGYTNIYKFRVHYKTWRNNIDQIGYFNIVVTIVNPTICGSDSGSISVNDPNNVLTMFDSSNYFICKSTNTSLQNFTLLEDTNDCNSLFPKPNDPTTFSGYQWQKSVATNVWTSIAGATSQNLTINQSSISDTSCFTRFRRVNITKIPCGVTNISSNNESSQIITIWNNSYNSINTTSNIDLYPYLSNTISSSLSNVALGTNNIVMCYGDRARFNTSVTLANCNAPIASNSSYVNHIKAYFVINYTPGTSFTSIPSSSILASVDQDFTGASFQLNLPYFNYQAINGNGFNFSGASTSVQVPITLVTQTTINGCTSAIKTQLFISLEVIPRAIGGTIVPFIVNDCPLEVQNGPDFTVGFDPSGNLTQPDAYVWSYCTSFTGNICNSTWTPIAGQGGLNLPLSIPAILGVPKPYLIKRTAKSGNNCGGVEDSNSILINNSGVPPGFSLPTYLCRTASASNTFTMPLATPSVNGNWFSYTLTTDNSTSPPSSIATIGSTPITTLDLNSIALGLHSYIFVPFSSTQNNGICYDFAIWNVTLYNTVTPTFSNLTTTYCDTTAPFVLPTTSSNGLTGSWSVQYNNISIPVTQWNPSLYTTYDTNHDDQLTLTFTANNSTTNNPCNSALDVVFTIKRTINFSNLPLALCQGSVYTLPTQSSILAGHWTLGATTVTQVDTTVPGTYTYTYNGTNTCQAYTYNVAIIAPNSPAILSGVTMIHPGGNTAITASIPNGTWSSSNPLIATVDTNGNVQGINMGTTTITYAITSTTVCPSAVSSITINVVDCTDSTTWNGTSWSNGVPNTAAFLNTAVIFNGTYDSTEDLFACRVNVNNGTVTIKQHIIATSTSTTTTANTLTVMNEVVVAPGANLYFEDDSSLVQINDFANTGNIRYKRSTSPISNFDYTYWSSPVDGQTLFNFSSDTLSDKFYGWNPLINNWVYTPPTTTIMNPGQGYIVRGPQANSFGVQKFDGYFIGRPHNGPYTTPVYNAASNLNLIGNPYPSGLDIDCFLADPANAHLNGTIYLWCHNIPVDFTGGTQQNLPGSAVYNYNVNSYGAYNRMGGVGTGIVKFDQSDLLSDRCLGKIGAGQSFFIESNATGVATFKNTMRVGSQNQTNSQFFRTTPQAISPAESSTCISEERHRLWLHLRNLSTPQQFKQTLIGYSPLATTSATLDRNYDAETFVMPPYTIDFYTLSPSGTPLTIQGCNLGATFNVNDVIPLGYTCKLNGTGPNTIQLGISEEDGLFDNQEVYLRENVSGVYHYYNLKAAPYTFTLNADEQDNITRFAIVFVAPNTTSLTSTYCSKTNMLLSNYITTTAVTGQQGYEWLITRQSDNSFTTVITPTSPSLFLNNTAILTGFIRYNETYCIRVHALVNGVWSAYGPECCITTANLTTSITNCTNTITSLATNISVTNTTTTTPPSTISVTPGYSWKVTNLSTGETRSFITTTTNYINFTNPALTTPNGFVSYNTPYSIQVRHLNIGSVDNLSYSTICNTIIIPTTQLNPCTTGFTVPALNQNIYASQVSNTTGYQWEVTNMTTGTIRIFTTNSYYFTFNNTYLTSPSGFVTNGTQYNIRVRPVIANSPFGDVCSVWTPGSSPLTSNPQIVSNKIHDTDFNIITSPNPFEKGFQFQLISPTNSEVHLQLYDILGQLILDENYTPEALENHIFGTGFASGVYQAVLRQDDYYEVVKVIKN